MIHFVRHGQTDTNLKEAAGTAVEEDDAPLNETGIKQAERTAEELKDIKFDVILTSPLRRARQTAEIIGKYHDVPTVVEDGLREFDVGRIEGDLWQRAFDFGDSIEYEGEKLEEFFKRIYAEIESIKERYADKNVLVVAHGGVHHGFYAYFNDLPWKGNMRIDRMYNGDSRTYEFKK